MDNGGVDLKKVRGLFGRGGMKEIDPRARLVIGEHGRSPFSLIFINTVV